MSDIVSLQNILVAAFLLIAVIAAAVGIYFGRKKGKTCFLCSGDCSQCRKGGKKEP